MTFLTWLIYAGSRRINLYETPQKLGLPISYVLQLAAAKAAGLDDAALRAQTEEFRRVVAGYKR